MTREAILTRITYGLEMVFWADKALEGPSSSESVRGLIEKLKETSSTIIDLCFGILEERYGPNYVASDWYLETIDALSTSIARKIESIELSRLDEDGFVNDAIQSLIEEANNNKN